MRVLWSTSKIAACAYGILAGAACAIKPLPQDVTGLNTYAIVQRIRCEVRDEIRSNIFQFIRTANNGVYSDLAKDLHNGDVDFDSVPRRVFDSETRRILDRYDGATVTYDFTFDITEDNNTSTSIGLVRNFRKAVGMDNLGLSLGGEFKRQNQRILRVHDSFAGLLSIKYPQRFCLTKTSEENGIYPITGKINVQDQIFTFLSLNQSGNLDALKDTGTAPAISDNIKFTTKLSGGINPSYALTPISHSWVVKSEMANLNFSREDVHQVIIVLALPLDGITRTDRFTAKSILEQRERDEALVERARSVELLGEIRRIGNQLQ